MSAGNRKYIFTIEELDEILDVENSIVIYGVGDYGKRIADYIFSVGKQSKIETFWVSKIDKNTKQDYKGIEALTSSEGYLRNKDSLIIVAVSFVYLLEVVEIVQQYGRQYCCVTADLYRELGGKLELGQPKEETVPFRELDFLVPGFAKCGTTSLYRAISNVADIYLPPKKESAFFRWCDKVDEPKKRLIDEYFNGIKDGQIVGMIDPGFCEQDKIGQLRELFGSHIKILFLVRNPVNAMFSEFKMFSRTRKAVLLHDAYQKTGGILTEDTFDKYFEQYKELDAYINEFKYTECIKQFLKYYPKDQIKIVLFEELIKYSRKGINDILRFIGSSCRYMHDELPYENEGKFAMADIKGLEIAERTGRISFEYRFLEGISDRSREEIFSELVEAEDQYNHAKKVYDLKLSKEYRRKLELYYNDSVRELEKVLDKDLSQIWF